jgi:hypothetical protein
MLLLFLLSSFYTLYSMDSEESKPVVSESVSIFYNEATGEVTAVLGLGAQTTILTKNLYTEQVSSKTSMGVEGPGRMPSVLDPETYALELLEARIAQYIDDHNLISIRENDTTISASMKRGLGVTIVEKDLTTGVTRTSFECTDEFGNSTVDPAMAQPFFYDAQIIECLEEKIKQYMEEHAKTIK